MPNTLEENVNRVKAAKTAIANAITAKGGTVGANDGLEDFASDIATIPSGGGGSSQPRKDVNFYDYDGTIVNSYTAAEFAELTAMPDNPTHEGLTAQGWNWSLSDAKSYVASYGKLEIGQMYITSDGKTRLYITLTEGRISPVLQLYLNANSEIDIDWGDGSTHSTFTSTSAGYQSERHNYVSAGDYIITITVITGSFVLRSSSTNVTSLLWNENNSTSSPDSSYYKSITKVEIGNNITQIGNYAFKSCSLVAITIPSSITQIGNYAFNSCYCLRYITLPSLLTSLGNYAFQYDTALKTVSLPNNSAFSTLGISVFESCNLLKAVTIPSSITSLNMKVLRSTAITSVNIPNSVTSIASDSFSQCYGLATITIDKVEGSISGSPWGAITSSPTSTQIIWTGE